MNPIGVVTTELWVIEEQIFSSFFFFFILHFLHLCSELQSEQMDVQRSFLKQTLGTDTTNARSGISLLPRVLRLGKARMQHKKSEKGEILTKS